MSKKNIIFVMCFILLFGSCFNCFALQIPEVTNPEQVADVVNNYELYINDDEVFFRFNFIESDSGANFDYFAKVTSSDLDIINHSCVFIDDSNEWHYLYNKNSLENNLTVFMGEYAIEEKTNQKLYFNPSVKSEYGLNEYKYPQIFNQWMDGTYHFYDNSDINVLYSSVPIYDNWDSVVNYLEFGILGDALYPESHEKDISFSSFKVVPHKSASFDNFYFEIRYELSPYVQNNLDNAIITVTQKYEGSLLVEKIEDSIDPSYPSRGLFSSYSYGPYSKSITIPLKYARAGFTPYLKDMAVFDEYFSDCFPTSYLYFDSNKKMQLLGYENWLIWDTAILDSIKTFKPASSRLYFIGNITVNGESGKPFTFCYDFLEGQGETEYIPWEEDEPDPQPIVDTVVPDDEPIVDTSTDGNGVNINIDIDNNNGGGSGEYVDVNPDDYRSFIYMYKDTMGEFKTEGNTFEFLKGAMSCLPSDIWALIAGGLGACIVISLIVIFRGR